MKKTIIFIITMLISTWSFAQHEGHGTAKSGIDPVMTAYYKVKNALVESDAKTVATEAEKLAGVLKTTGGMVGGDAIRAAKTIAGSSTWPPSAPS